MLMKTRNDYLYYFLIGKYYRENIKQIFEISWIRRTERVKKKKKTGRHVAPVGDREHDHGPTGERLSRWSLFSVENTTSDWKIISTCTTFSGCAPQSSSTSPVITYRGEYTVRRLLYFIEISYFFFFYVGGRERKKKYINKMQMWKRTKLE